MDTTKTGIIKSAVDESKYVVYTRNLEKLGCGLQADLELTGKQDIPFAFVDIGELDI